MAQRDSRASALSKAHQIPPRGAVRLRESRALVVLGVIATAIFAALAILLAVGVGSGGVVVSVGYRRQEGDSYRRRGCVGFTHRPDSRDGWTDYCYGVPVGAWRCYESENLETAKLWMVRVRELSCYSGAPVSEWRCSELLYDRASGTSDEREVACANTDKS